MTFLIC